MRFLFSAVMVFLLAVIAPGVGHAQLIPGLTRSSGEPVTARAELSSQPLIPGKPAEIVVELTINRAYHVQSAFAPAPYIAAQVMPASTEGLAFGVIEAQKGTDIPTPPALGSGTLSVYQGKAYFLIPVTVAVDAAAGERTLDIAVRTQACDDTTCLPPKTLRLQVKAKIGTAADTPVETDPALTAAAHKAEFLPMPIKEAATTPAVQTAPAAAGPGMDVPLLNAEQQLAVIKARPYQPFNSEKEEPIAVILLSALLGGLILNVMPCVLPVIPLKALSFVQHAHGNHRVAMLHSLAFSAGIVTLFVALAVVLRTGGLFYGQQFQSPAFLITMALFVVALALSMLGVWTINPPQMVYKLEAKIAEASSGPQGLDYAAPREPGGARAFLGSYGNGLMATLLATPCSAPFLGPVFAWAFTKPMWLTALALAVVGVGMSLPYFVLAAFPKLLARVPRAGRWSELLKQGLGIVMLGVGIYLITRIPNTRLWFWGLIASLAIALVCWGWGQIPSLTMTVRRIWTIRAVVLAIGLLMGAGIMTLAANAARPADGRWVPFNVALLDKALKDGRPVVVDWTADWCINCQAVDVAVLSREETQKAFVDSNALLLRADLSEDNPPATELNRKLGGEAIPVLAIFSPSRPEQPVVLRDIYSQARVIAEIQAAR